MVKTRFKHKTPILLTITVNVVLMVAVVFLMNYVQKLLYSDVRINLTEVVTQNKDVVKSKLKLEVNTLELAATQIGSQLKQAPDLSAQSFATVIADYRQETEDDNIYVANKEGVAFFVDGRRGDIAGRRYFRLAVEGKQNISDKIISRITGDDVFVISVPLYLGNKIIGTVQKSYTSQEMYALCTLSLFSSQGYMHIINKEGYILVTSQNAGYSLEADNYYRNIYAQGNQEAAKRLETDIQQEKPGFMETVIGGEKLFTAYTPIEEIHEWYLISSIATKAVSPNANMVIRMFYFILIVVVCVSGTSLFAFLLYKNRQQATLKYIAFVDPITGGNTYNKFLMDLDDALHIQPEHQSYLLAFDIDNFKYVNSYYGFDFGDRILKDIYLDVTQELLAGETMARISGDHFIVLLQDASEERLKKLLKQSVVENGIQIYLSAGLYAITDLDESTNLMVDKARSSAQMAKGSLVRNVISYSEEYNRTMINNEQLKRQIDEAIVNREIIPYYQPKVDVNTKKLIGAEALARWRTRDGQMISPGYFIPLCEKTGQIVDVDFLVFEQVLEFLVRNREAGIRCVPISVNFSRIHLLGDGFVHKIITKLQEYQVSPEFIQIELTESVFSENIEAIIDLVNHLHEHGLLLCIDDFGSGYSSLNMLKEIPIDVLKIDKGFLDETDEPKRQRIILSTIAELAKRLNIDVVVEGVETKENVALMREFGCSVAQGYYFARPMDEKSFETIFERGSVC